MKQIICIILLIISLTTTAQNCPEKKVTVERLPNLNTPRSGHVTFVAGDEVVVVGGHTTGFVPTATAERLTNGKWEQMASVYTHDEGFAVRMQSGKVLIGGGHIQPLGIGNQFSLEEYDIESHTLHGYGCLDKKRCWAQGVELDSGKVLISGNWFEEDGIELYEGKVNNTFVKAVRQNRAMPYIFLTAKDDAIIFSPIDERARQHDTIWIDHLKGEPTTEPLFTTWRPLPLGCTHNSEYSFIGDRAKGDYSYLMAVEDTLTRHIAIVKVTNGQFSLLKTASEIPAVCQGDSISWISQVITDQQRERGYLVGTSIKSKRFYILYIMYKEAGINNDAVMPLMLCYTDPLPDVGVTAPVLTQDGNLLIAGGIPVPVNNFEPFATVVLIHTGDGETSDSGGIASTYGSFILWLVLGLIALTVVGFMAYKVYKANKSNEANKPNELNETDEPQPSQFVADNEELMCRIDKLMESDQLFLNTELKVADIAQVLGVNSRYVSDSIKVCRNCLFAQYLNGKRVEYAKRMMQQSPDKKLSEVWAISGFSNESTFFRAFKSATGVTPNEWKNG